MDKKELQDFYLDYLKEEGYKASLDDDEDIVFKYEGHKYWLSVDEEDEKYFEIGYGCEWEFESDEEKIKSLKVSSSVNSEYKLGKIWVNIDEGIVQVELNLLLAKQDDFKIFFLRCLDTVQYMMADFAEKMEK
jgi:copper chaperone CopZ